MNQEQQAITPFIRPHQFNYIRQQIMTLIGAFYFAGDYRVLDASRESVADNILSTVDATTPEQQALLQEAIQVRDHDELKNYMLKLEPYIIPFPQITPAELKKLFPKVKKLVLPNFEELDFAKMTYLGWRDIATNSLYLVHHINGKFIGTECRYVLGQKNRSYICHWCNRAFAGDDVALVTTLVKNRKIQDGYRTQGNHLCLNSLACNAHLKSTTEMEAFLASLR